MVVIDGSIGEGGGQVLRSSLSLSMVTGQPVKLKNIRSKRKNPGLRSQHLCAVRASAEICDARVEGDTMGSRSFTFVPGQVKPGEYTFTIGTAGSSGLVFQTVLPPLMLASGPSKVTLEGGTHNSQSPPFDFLERVFVPLVNRMGPSIALRLDSYGFYPKGGGRFSATVAPVEQLTPIDLIDGGAVGAVRANAIVAGLPDHVARRELAVVRERLGWDDEALSVSRVRSRGPGNALCLEVAREGVAELFTAFGEKGRPAEAVARRACDMMQAYLDNGAPVGPHLADQLLLPFALAGGGSFVTCKHLDAHTTTNMAVVSRFLPVDFALAIADGRATVRAERRG